MFIPLTFLHVEKNHAIQLETRKLVLNSQLYLTLEKTSFKTHGVYICKHRVRQPLSLCSL